MDFEKDVIKRSEDLPVVVDFWAPWCGPCKFLGPVIEELAKENTDKWELVKVNTDENKELSTKYEIRGIPAVKMFWGGEVMAEFTGALPRPQIEKWLEAHLPDPRSKDLSEILKSLNGSGQNDLTNLESFIELNPDYLEARVAFARHVIFSDSQKAADLLEDITLGHKYYDLAEDIRHINQLMQTTGGGNKDLDKRLDDVQVSLRSGDLDSAMEALIGLIIADKNYCQELPRKAAIGIFNLTGPDNSVTQNFRRRFDMALY